MHSGLEVLLRQAQEWLYAFRRIHDTNADDMAIIEALFSGVYETAAKPMPNIRAIEDDAVLAALDDLAKATAHGIELDQQEQLAMQAPVAIAQPAGSSAVAGGEQVIEISFEGWDIGVGKVATPPPAAVEPASVSLNDQLKASLGVDWANVKQPEPVKADEAFDAVDLSLMQVDTSQQTAVAMADKAAGMDDYLREELAAQVEAMVRAYARRRLRPLLEQFEVLEVEREGEWKLGEALLPEDLVIDGEVCGVEQVPTPIIFMSRLDALLLERQTGYLYLQSYKTTGQWDRRREADAQVDMQGLSEAVDVENRLGGAWQFLNDIREMKETLALATAQNEKFTWDRITKSENLVMGLVNSRTMEWLRHVPEPPKVLGVRYEYLLKGPRRQDKKDLTPAGFARYVADTPLIRAYKQDGITFDDRRWCHSYDWFEITGKSRRLDYRSWAKAPVWKFMPIADWIDKLDKGEVQPDCYDEHGNALDILAEQFVTPIHVFRNEDDMRDMLEQLEAQETQMAEDVAAVQARGRLRCDA